MDLDVTSPMSYTRQKTSIVPTRRRICFGIEFFPHRWKIMELPNTVRRAERQAIVRQRDPHGLFERAKMSVQNPVLRS